MTQFPSLWSLKVIVDALEESKVLLKGQIEEITKEKEDLQKKKETLVEERKALDFSAAAAAAAAASSTDVTNSPQIKGLL